MRRGTLATGAICAALLLAGCGSTQAAAPRREPARTLTGHVAANHDYVVPVAFCHSEQLDQSQLNLTTCAGEEATSVGNALARSLAVESTFLGDRPVGAAQRLWSRYASAQCSLEVRQYLGGSAYDMVAAQCVEGLELSRLREVDSLVRGLRAAEVPTHPAGRYAIDVPIPDNRQP